MNPTNDPRVFFSAERTLLAWIRTGLTVIGIGFVVARFGVFLRLVARDPHATQSTSSTFLGVAFVLLGALGIALGVVQFVRFSRGLPAHDRPANYRIGWSVWFASLVALTGVLLAIYLLVQSAGL